MSQTAPPPTQTQDRARLPAAVVALLALVSGAAVANLYYAQPLLSRIAHAFAVSDGTSGLLVSATQLGYVAGLALLVPLGDLLERRRLLGVLTALAGAGAAVCAAAPSFPVLAAAMVGLGAMSVVAQIVVALASTLAGDHERGRVVGTVMSGLLIGILVARTLSGVVAALGGWRLTFAVAAGAMLALAIVLRGALPVAPPTERVAYGRALRSVVSLIVGEPLLRRRMLLGALGFGSFSVLWTTVAFLLSGPPYHYNEAVIGLFGLAGAAGALAAPAAGRLADRGHGRLGMTAFLLCVLASWGLLALGGRSLAALLVGIVVLDLGVQGAHISNQTVIYGLRAQARSRLTTAYMVSVFLGGLVGSLLSAGVYGAGGWDGVCALGAGVAGVAVGAWALMNRVPARQASRGAVR
jgi:predicted MFS family arabinose efflux permease